MYVHTYNIHTYIPACNLLSTAVWYPLAFCESSVGSALLLSVHRIWVVDSMDTNIEWLPIQLAPDEPLNFRNPRGLLATVNPSTCCLFGVFIIVYLRPKVRRCSIPTGGIYPRGSNTYFRSLLDERGSNLLRSLRRKDQRERGRTINWS